MRCEVVHEKNEKITKCFYALVLSAYTIYTK